MANIPLKSIKFPGLDDTYTVPQVDDDLDTAGAAADAKATGDALTEINERLGEAPKIVDAEETEADLYICDAQGNVIGMFVDGHIVTKEFNSENALSDISDINENIGDLSDLTTTAKDNLVEAINEAAQSGGSGGGANIVKNTTDSNADLYICDSNGNVIAYYYNGNIRTKNFSSDQNVYTKSFVYDDVAGTQVIDQFFPKGTSLVFHVVDETVGSDHIGSDRVTYGYTDTNDGTHNLGQEYGYNYFRATLPADAKNVYVTYPTALTWHNTATLVFSVCAEASFNRRPNIVTVSPDGKKDYTTLRAAVDAVAPLASDFTPYEIQVYPGTYNIIGNYSSAEIADNDFVGLMITNGISIVGIGNRSEIILSAMMDTSLYNATKRNKVSTINIKGNVMVENLTISAENIRYCVHDDFSSMAYKPRNTKIFKNVQFYCYNMTTGNVAYGSGGGNGKLIYCEDCDFFGEFHHHNSAGQVRPNFVTLKNCTAKRFALGDYANAVETTRVTLINCKASFLHIVQPTSHSDQTMFVDCIGTDDLMVSAPADYVFSVGESVKVQGQATKGYAVKYSSDALAVATAVNDVYGIVIGEDDGLIVVQTGGYISSNTFGLSGLSVGDYLTINSSGAVVSGGTSSNAIAKVKYIDSDGIAYAKMSI